MTYPPNVSCNVAHMDSAGNPIPCPDMLSVPEDEPRPVLRPARPWGCVVALLLWVAFWAVVITLVVHIVTPR